MDSISLTTTEQADANVQLDTVTLSPMIVLAPPRSRRYAIAQRTFDFGISLTALLLTLPIMLGLAVLIRIDSPGPALFRQKRVGKDGRLFTFYKFRTMWCDARARFPELYAYQYSEREIQTMCFKLTNDPRLTSVGCWLRKTSLDELPNFLNVLVGTMTLVGPRPEIPEMVQYYTAEQQMKFSVKPGVTGLAQISGRGHLRFQATIDADLEYCLRRSTRYDVEIFTTTVCSMFARNGAF